MDKYVYHSESDILEYKANNTKTYLKTVSAFANYKTGSIIFGIDDNGNPVELEDPKTLAQDIENTINDSIAPVPRFMITPTFPHGPVELTVFEGKQKPYLYKAKAYRRSGTSTVPVSSIELNRLVLEGMNLSYDATPATDQHLTFHYLAEEFEKRTDIENFNLDILRTLGLYTNKDGYNRAAELFADLNSYPGTDVVRFGDNISIMLDRKTTEHCSILEAFENSMAMYRQYYQYEVVEGERRKTVERIPEKAFREGLANALIHRQWDVNAQVQIAMYHDRIEITSPGKLPDEVSENEYWERQVSVLRNPKVAEVFFKLHLIEHYGTGTQRIREEYEDHLQQPHFEQTDNYMIVVLPVVDLVDLSQTEEAIINALLPGMELSRAQLEERTGIEKYKLIRTLNELSERGLIIRIGAARATRYKRG